MVLISGPDVGDDVIAAPVEALSDFPSCDLILRDRENFRIDILILLALLLRNLKELLSYLHERIDQHSERPEELPRAHRFTTGEIDELQIEQEKLRKLLQQMIHGNRSEKRIFPGADQALLPFESEEEFQGRSSGSGGRSRDDH